MLTLLHPQAQAQFTINDANLRVDGSLELHFDVDDANYYRLISGGTVETISTPVRLGLTSPFITPASSESTRFFVVQQIPRPQSFDTDNDDIPDVYELLHPPLDGLSNTDAASDPDGNGRTALQEYLDSIQPEAPLTITQISPAPGESGVSVNRETIIYFSVPLASDVSLSPASLTAFFGDRKILSRAELSSDRRKATLFYLEPLPASARIAVNFQGAGLRGSAGQEIDADRDGKPGGSFQFFFDTQTTAPIGRTAVIGHVFASEPIPDPANPRQFANRPLAGVTITVDGMEETLRTTTDANGFFKLQPSPVGRFFVHVDGRTIPGSGWPDGDYYPFVGKAWETVAGVETNLAGGNGVVFLPLIPAGALKPVSNSQNTVVTFAPQVIDQNTNLAGVNIEVPAGSLFSNDGRRGGRVGLAAVRPDRLPEPLPPGVEMPLVITVQTDGPSNFDRPVPVRFPNLPDAQTGERLKPGAKTALVSFNHDTGVWEIAGTMTISPDGQFAISDPGTGIRQPGWHGTSPLSGGNGGGSNEGGAGGSNGPNGGNGGPGGNNGGGGPGGPGAAGGGGDGDDDDTAGPTEGDDGGDEDAPPPPDDDGGNPPGGDCARPLSDFAAIRLLNPYLLEPGAGGLGDPWQAPKLSQHHDVGILGDVMGNQHIELTCDFEPSERVSLLWLANNGNPKRGNERIFRLNFPLNNSNANKTNEVTLTVRIKDENGEESKQCFKMLVVVLPNSGAHFESMHRSPKDTTLLQPAFRASMDGFINALRAGGANVTISAVFRAQKRAYMMRYSDIIANGTKNRAGEFTARPGAAEHVPDYDPNLPGVKANCDGSPACAGKLYINWLHLRADGRIDRQATIAGASALYSAYNIASRAAFPTDKHGAGLAVDMTITWTGDKTFNLPFEIVQPDGSVQTTVTIPAVQCQTIRCNPVKTSSESRPDQHCNQLLWQLGAAYGVDKLTCDMPHWQKN